MRPGPFPATSPLRRDALRAMVMLLRNGPRVPRGAVELCAMGPVLARDVATGPEAEREA